MNLCGSGHGEVCYDGRTCPACDILDELKDVKSDLAKAQAEIEELNLESQ
jgi:hypothetical protein